MSGDTLTIIISVVGSMFGLLFMVSRGHNQLRGEFKEEFREIHKEFKEIHRELKEVRMDIAAVNERLSSEIAAVNERLSSQIAAVNERLSSEIAAVNERLSHSDGLIEGLTRTLLKSSAA